MTLKSNKIFVNLPVKNLGRSTEFFTKVGYAFEPQMTDENATCMVVSEQIYVMLLVEPFFQSFTKKEITDTSTSKEVIIALSAESRQQVDEIVDRAMDAGASPANEPMDHGFMYSRSFHDPDGHLWEFMYMDPTAME